MTFPLAHITFRTNSAEISGADPIPVLEEVAAIMQRHPDIRVSVVGHTDSVGADAYNLDLSMRRAQSVISYLVDKGIARHRFEADGKGEAQPISSNDTATGRARNRRIEFAVIK